MNEQLFQLLAISIGGDKLTIVALFVVLLAWSAFGSAGNNRPAATVQPGPVPVPVPKPAPVAPASTVTAPVPPVVVKPVVALKPRNTGIKATDFAGATDSVSSKSSAYDGHQIDGENELACALPYHFPGARPPIRVFANGKSVNVPIEDVGPWFDGRSGWPVDQYWLTNARPRAETDSRTNGAGIDLTPAVYRALGFTGNLDDISTKVDWDFVSYFTSRHRPAIPSQPDERPRLHQPWRIANYCRCRRCWRKCCGWW
jgi:hypothetical protein